MWHKFYVCRFRNKKHKTPNGYEFIKFGVTRHMNVEDRFNPSIDDGYSKNYEDWEIKCMFSQVYYSKEDAEKEEEFWLKEAFPYKSKYKVWVEKILGIDDPHYYSNSTGITELRLLPINEANQLYRYLHEQKRASKLQNDQQDMQVARL